MKSILSFVVSVLVIACVGQKTETIGNTETDSIRKNDAVVAEENEAEKVAFDFSKYRQLVLDNALPRFMKSSDDVNLLEYALIDIDGDGRNELWVRSDEGQDWQGVFAVDGDSVVLLADADVCSELDFFENAVGFSSYISPGRVEERYVVLDNSRISAKAEKYVEFDIFGAENEVESESYTIDDEDVDEADYDAFKDKLGDEVEVTAEWIPIQ